MLDLKHIRQYPEQYRSSLSRRGGDVDAFDKFLEHDEAYRTALSAKENNAASLRIKSAELAQRKRENKSTRKVQKECAALKDGSQTLSWVAAEFQECRDEILHRLPNWIDPAVPSGVDECDNVVLKTVGEQRKGGVPHWENPNVDQEAGAMLSGSRFTVVRGNEARLYRKIANFLLENAVDHGFEETQVPCIVNPDTLFGTGQLPKFKNDLYVTGDQYLAPTAEVMLTNLARGSLKETMRLTSLSPCFRKEAGSAGRDTRGMIRQHQFDKVELVTVCHPDDSDQELDRIVTTAEHALEQLGLSYRRVFLCAGDTGFSARKTYDLEVWMAGQQAWKEISSCSDCGDFQSRRMGVKIDKTYANTLNGSALAVGRCFAAVLETYGDDLPDILS